MKKYILIACISAAACFEVFSQAPPVLQIRPDRVVVIKGLDGTPYTIQYSDSLVPASWLSIVTVTPTNGMIAFQDGTESPVGARYFRAFASSTTNVVVKPITDMVRVAPGTFLMGASPLEEDAMDFETPQTQVTLTRSYWIAKHLVTQDDYRTLMHTNPAYFKGDLSRPVEQVSWDDANAYCYQLTLQESVAGHIPANWSYRLPTEAEWEFACRAGTTARFSFGDDPNYTVIQNYAWYWNNSYSVVQPSGVSWSFAGRFYTTHPVGQLLPNPIGLYDMHGNVWEWCRDWFGTYPGGSVTDPKGPASGPWHSFRGGSWFNQAPFERSASRGAGNSPDNFIGGLGFRVVLSENI